MSRKSTPQEDEELNLFADPSICVSLQFRVIDTPIPARGFIRQKQNAPRTTTPCIPKCDNVRFASAPCAKMYESIHREPTRFAHTKMWGFTTVLGDRHHVFTERVHREQMKFAFRYSFGRSTPRFYREGWPRENEICVSLQFWAIDTTFLPRGLTARKWNLRFATVLGHVFCERVDREQMKFAFRYSFGDRRRVFSERVDREKWNSRFATVLGDRRRVFSERVAFRLTLPIPPGGIE